jgi:hypothetical protein
VALCCQGCCGATAQGGSDPDRAQLASYAFVAADRAGSRHLSDQGLQPHPAPLDSGLSRAQHESDTIAWPPRSLWLSPAISGAERAPADDPQKQHGRPGLASIDPAATFQTDPLPNFDSSPPPRNHPA